MYRINNWDRRLSYFETDYKQRKYIKNLTFILAELEVICKRRYKEPTYSTYYRFYNLNAALCPAVVISYIKFSNEQSFSTKIGFDDSKSY